MFDDIINLKVFFEENQADKARQFYNILTADMPNAIYQLVASQLFCKVLDYQKTNCTNEAYPDFVEIQISLQNKEFIRVFNNHINKLERVKQYDEGTDYTFYKFPFVAPVYAQLVTSNFMEIYFLLDSHTTQIAAIGSSGLLKKQF